MSRLVLGIGLAALASGPAAAADFGWPKDGGFRPAYPVDWKEYENPLGFEAGIRYWYGMGEQNFRLGGGGYSATDEAHSLEAHIRIDDYSTATYLKGSVGFAGQMAGDFATPFEARHFEGGRLAYAGADFGYTPYGNDQFRFGGFIGYQYLNDSPEMGRRAFLQPDTLNWQTGTPNYTFSYDSDLNNVDVHALRLGVTARAELGDMIDVTADAALIPYAYTSGILGGHDFSFGIGEKSSATTFTGSLYGGAADVMVGFHPTENLTFRAGARGYFLTGPVTASYSRTDVAPPADLDGDGTFEIPPQTATQNYVQQFDNFELFRWGPVFELTYRF